MKSSNIKVTLIFQVVLFLFSCQSVPEEVQRALELAGENRKEIEEVIEHYSNDIKDSLKLKAAYFLIQNMPWHYSYYGKKIDRYDINLQAIGDNTKAKRTFAWDSLRFSGKILRINDLELISDISIVTSNLLIENIDYAFKAWEEMPWGKKINFDDFCNYILPYRCDSENIESWRPNLYNNYKKYIDSLNTKDPADIFRHIRNYHEFQSDFQVVGNSHYPIALNYEKLKKAKSGLCDDLCNLNLMALRSIGIPVSKDGASWANARLGHAWNTLMINYDSVKSQKRIAEYAIVSDKMHNDCEVPLLHERIAARIIRSNFAVQQRKEISLYNDEYSDYKDPLKSDVSEEYYDVQTVKLKTNSRDGLVYLCLFTPAGFVPGKVGTITNSELKVKKVVPGIVYFPMVKVGHEFQPCGFPFLLKSTGTREIFQPKLDSFHTLHIYRKNPLFAPLYSFAEDLKNAKIQGANRRDFKNFDELGVIKRIPSTMEYIRISNKKPYRYVRLNTTGVTQLAELEFYAKGLKSEFYKLSGKIISSAKGYGDNTVGAAFDGDWASYCDLGTQGWLGLDLGQQIEIVKVGYCPRTDTNMIIPGNEYELFYWDDSWISLGKKIGQKERLSYDDAPINAIFWLHNNSGGKEERIFIINKDGCQVFF